MRTRLQERDWATAHHLYRTRILTTGQVAELCFDGSFCAAQKRLYRLREAGFLKNSTQDSARVGTVWELEKTTFGAFSDEGEREKYPKPVSPWSLRHRVSTNDVYVKLAPLMDGVPRMDPADWEWRGEPACHREYGEGSKLKPDAEVRLFDEEAYFVERQTASAKEKPEKLHDKVFGYHRYENTPERRGEPVKTMLLFACDESRDSQAALQARRDHPTRKLHELGLRDYHDKRIGIYSGTTEEIVAYILGEAQRLAP